MLEISRFFGVIIRMYAEPGAPHHRPHFHAYYQNQAAVYGIDPVEMISGALPLRQQRFVEAWAELHIGELQEARNGCSLDNFLSRLHLYSRKEAGNVPPDLQSRSF